MSSINSRYVQIDGWIFELKTIRAIKAENYGPAYSAIANFTLQSDHAHIDGLMTRTKEDFSRADHQAFEKFFAQIGIKSVSFERYSPSGFKTTNKLVDKNMLEPKLTLVK